MMVRMGFLNKFEFKMAAFSTDLASHAIIIHIIRTEHRCAITRTEWLELL